MIIRRFTGLLVALSSAALSLTARDASACGGGFAPPADPQNPETVTIAAQRMAFAVSPTQTVLWSQIQYEGPPSEFAWVLPIGPGATIELANQIFFDALEAATSTHVAPPGVCAADFEPDSSSSGGCGCGALGAQAGDGDGRGFQNGADQVEVVNQGSLGPYETVTLSSKDGEAVKDWLVTNGYAVPEDVAPILDEYTKQGMDFIALRLKAGSTTNQMQPVRVVTKGASPVIPFRMMVAGARETVPVTLYVLSEGRYAPESYPEAKLGADQIQWDFSAEKSNYADIRAAALAKSEGGRGFLTTFALEQGLYTGVTDNTGAPVAFSRGDQGEPLGTSSIAGLYGAFTSSLPSSATCFALESRLNDSKDKKVEDCASEACPEGSVSASEFGCPGAEDIAAALVGMHPKDVWVTRLEANLPRSGLTQDLTLKAAAAQENVSSWVVAGQHTNCENGLETASFVAPKSRSQSAAWMGGIAFVGASVLRRRRARGARGA